MQGEGGATLGNRIFISRNQIKSGKDQSTHFGPIEVIGGHFGGLAWRFGIGSGKNVGFLFDDGGEEFYYLDHAFGTIPDG
jgi:hypothetical protein